MKVKVIARLRTGEEVTTTLDGSVEERRQQYMNWAAGLDIEAGSAKSEEIK